MSVPIANIFADIAFLICFFSATTALGLGGAALLTKLDNAAHAGMDGCVPQREQQ